MILRALKIALHRHDWQPPRGATHVLQWCPPWLQEPVPAEGCWDLDALDDWLAGTPQPMATLDGPPTADADDLRAFVEAEFGEQYRLDGFKVEISADGSIPGPVVVPAYWVSLVES